MAMSKKKVRQIKVALAASEGRDQPTIAAKFKVSRSLVSDIFNGKCHNDVAWPDGYTPVPLPAKGQRKKIDDHDPTNRKVMELEAEVIHLKEEVLIERRKVKAGAKSQGIFKALVNEFEGVLDPLEPLPSIWTPPKKVGITEDVVMHLSDMHADQVILPSECGGLEEYNFQIACRRAEKYVDTVLEWTQDTLKPKFTFPRLTILSYGDQTSGEIHGHGHRSYYRNQFKNCFAVGKLKALMIRDLAPHFESVNVVCLPGNHGRRSIKKDHHGAHDNWDYLIAEIARMHCESMPNVSFLIPDAWSINIDINGVGFNISHGDDIKGWAGVPFYGMLRKQKGLIALGAATGTLPIRYFVMGHHHVAASLADVKGELLVNGAWPGTDAYAYNSFAGYREPSQWLHGVNPKHGITWRMNCKLRSPGESEGPKRYKIDGGRDIGPLV